MCATYKIVNVMLEDIFFFQNIISRTGLCYYLKYHRITT